MILLSTVLDEYGAMIGLSRRTDESLKDFKKRILFATKKQPSSSIEGMQNYLDSTLGAPIPVASFEPNETQCRLLLKGNVLIVGDQSSTIIERDNNISWDNFQDLIAPYFSRTMITQGLVFNMNRVRNIDNLKNREEVLLGDQIHIMEGQNVFDVVFSDNRYEPVNDIELIDDYLYYVDKENGIIFCGSSLYGRITYSYLDSFTVLKSYFVVDALNSFDIDNSEHILHPLVTDAYNQYPISNVWR